MPGDILADEIERLISEIATERRIQMNAREQRELAERAGGRHVGPRARSSRCCDDDVITDIMVNGPTKVFVERRGKVGLSNVRFRDAAHLINVCQRIAAGVGRRIDEAARWSTRA